MTDDTIKKLILTIYAMQEECRHMNNGGGTWVGAHFISKFDEHCPNKVPIEERLINATNNVFIQASKYEQRFIEYASKHTLIQPPTNEKK